MPYTFSTPYAAAAYIDSAVINNNNESLRAYLNKLVDTGDIKILSIDSPEIVKGEPMFAAGDHQFTCGNQYNQFVDGEDVNKDYFTGQIKTIDASSNEMWWVLSETGKTITLEAEGKALIHAGIEISSDQNYAMDYDDDGALDNDGLGSKVMLRIDGVRKPVTYMYSFEETAVNTGPSQTVAAFAKRRWYPISYLTEDLAAGEHEIVFVIDPLVDRGAVIARNVTIEVFYN